MQSGLSDRLMKAKFRDSTGAQPIYRLSGESVSRQCWAKRYSVDLKSKKLGKKFVFGLEQKSKFNFRYLVHYLAEVQKREK